MIAHTNFSYTKAITLTDNDICGIFSGYITDWSGIQAIPGKTTAPKGLGGALTVQDPSGRVGHELPVHPAPAAGLQQQQLCCGRDLHRDQVLL